MIMKKFTKLILVFAVLAFLLLPTRSAQAQDPSVDGGKVIFGQSFTLKSGEKLSGDLVVFGGNVVIEKEANIEGSVVVFGGNVDFAESAGIKGDMAIIGGSAKVNGVVDGNMVVVGGQISLTDTAVVHGDIASVGGQIARDPKARVDGNVVENIAAPSIEIPKIPNLPNIPDVPDVQNPPVVNVNVNPVWEVINVFLRALAVAVLAVLLTLFLQPQLERVSHAIVRQPVVAGAFGLLTIVLSPLVLVILIITLILIPVALLAAFILPLAWLFGVIALGQEVGERFTKAINQTWVPVLTTGFGAFMLMLVGGYIGMIPCVGWLATFLIGIMGIGGVAMTWFGTRPAPGAMVIQQPVEVPPAS
jgi:cytoskeletal protein CcmA (bactofilin family)